MATFKNIRKNTEYSLNKEAREEYFWRCNEMVCKNDGIEESIEKNLNIIYKITESLLNSYNKYLNKQDKSDYEWLQSRFDIIKSDERPFTLETLNVKTLQCVIIITDINLGTLSDEEYNIIWKDKELEDKFERYKLSNYANYDILYRMVKKDNVFKHLLGFTETTNYSCCPDLKGALIMVPLGEMSLYELVYTLANNIYLIGVTTSNQYADGKYFTPFEFVNHDIKHSLHRKNTIHDGDIKLDYEKKFIENIPSKLNSGSEPYVKMMIALFLIMHETFKIEEMLNSPYIPYLNFKAIKIGAFKDTIGNLDNWRNVNYYGGLLPKEVREGTDKAITNYLDECFTILKDEWNTFHAESTASGGRRRRTRKAGSKRKTQKRKSNLK